VTQYDGGQFCPREVTEIHVVTLVEFGPVEAHAFGLKSGIREITNRSKLFFLHGTTAPVSQGLLVEDLPPSVVMSLARPWKG